MTYHEFDCLYYNKKVAPELEFYKTHICAH